MVTFHFEVDNLGPIKSAHFNASRFNVLCGKNNSGKSICMHTAFCFFKEWRERVHVYAKPDLAEKIFSGEKATFSVKEYLGDVNPAIAKSLPGFSSSVKNLLNKTSSSFDAASISVSMDDTFLLQTALDIDINVYLNINDSIRIRCLKRHGDESVSIWLENKGEGEFPSHELISSSINRLIDYLYVDKILPEPYLLTAERSGSILYGDDLRSLSFFENRRISGKGVPSFEDDKNHYAAPYVRELQNIWAIEQGAVKSDPYGTEPNSNAIREQLSLAFTQYVADGEFKLDGGKIYFVQKGHSDPLRLNEVSTSARALAQLYYLVQRSMQGNMLLMIDEPELNLHPERQRSLVRLMALMKTLAGTSIAVTTHSDIIIRELNTLIAFGSNPQRYEKLMKRYGYNRDEVLLPGEVACAIVEKGGIRQLAIKKGAGLAIPSFDRTLDEINAIQNAIVDCWDSFEK